MRINSHQLCRAAAVLLCTLAVTTASAGVKYLIVSRTDGTKASFALADDPVVKNSASELTVETSAATITVPFADFENYSFSESGVSAVKEILTDESHTISDGQITFTGLRQGTSVSVYSLEGQKVLQTSADTDGFASINLMGLQSGVYIVHTSSSSIKFIVK